MAISQPTIKLHAIMAMSQPRIKLHDVMVINFHTLISKSVKKYLKLSVKVMTNMWFTRSP